MGYWDTMLEYYLPGVDHKALSDEEYLNKLAHLAMIRRREADNKGAQ